MNFMIQSKRAFMVSLLLALGFGLVAVLLGLGSFPVLTIGLLLWCKVWSRPD